MNSQTEWFAGFHPLHSLLKALRHYSQSAQLVPPPAKRFNYVDPQAMAAGLLTSPRLKGEMEQYRTEALVSSRR